MTPVRTPRGFAFLAVFLFIVLSVCSISGQGASIHDVDYHLFMELELEFETATSGSLRFYFGTHAPRALSPVSGWDTNVSSYDNKFLSITHENFTRAAGTNESTLRALLDLPYDVSVGNVIRRMENNSKYFGLSFSCSFEFDTDASRAEYRYLGFIRSLEVDKYSQKDLAQKFLKSVDLIQIHLVVNPEDGIALSKRSDGIFHTRSITSESLDQSTTVTSFNLQSNKLIVEDSPLKAPFTLFTVMVVLLCIGICALVLIWKRNRFRTFGLILPIAAIVAAGFTIFQFFLPHISLYGYHGLNIYLWTFVFLCLVTASRFVNPDIRFKSLEEERTDQAKRAKTKSMKKVKLPKVIYVEKFIERPAAAVAREKAIDPYRVIGVDRSDPYPVIKKAYLKKVKQYHPDMYTNSPERIREAASKEMESLNKAYEMISEMHGKK